MCVSAFAPTPHALITPIAAIVARFVARRPRAHRPRLASPARRAIVLSFRARVRVASLAVRSLARSSVAVCRRAAAPSRCVAAISGVSPPPRVGARAISR
jgi:hypothetical protein